MSAPSARGAVLVGVVLASSGIANALEIDVPPTPTVQDTCRVMTGWDAMKKCIESFGKLTIERTLGGVKLARVTQPDRSSGLYLLGEQKNVWKFVGALDTGVEYTVLDFRRVTINGIEGFRIDAGTSFPMTYLLDDQETALPGRMQQRYAVFCSGKSASCVSVVVSCDTYVGGKAASSYRGTLSISKDDLVVRTDLDLRGSRCGGTEAHQPLRFTWY